MKNILLIVVLFVNSCFGQKTASFKLTDVKDPQFAKYDYASYSKLRQSAVRITKYLPRNYSKNGDVNYTDYLQKALNENLIVLFPDFPIMIDSRGLSIRSNQNLLFEKGGLLILKGNSAPRYEMLRIHNVSNVKVFYPNLKGDRKTHVGSEGEWGFGVSIRSSRNIKVYNPTLVDMWGDGIYIGQIDNVPSEGVKIVNGFINTARRNGVSITSGRNITLQSMFISNTNGTEPNSAIDIEPNSKNDHLSGIRLNDIRTANNKQGGLLMALHLFGTEKGKRNIDVKVTSFSDINSAFGIGIKGLDVSESSKLLDLHGAVDFSSIDVSKSRVPYRIDKSKKTKIKFTGDANVVNQLNKHLN